MLIAAEIYCTHDTIDIPFHQGFRTFPPEKESKIKEFLQEQKTSGMSVIEKNDTDPS